MKGLLLWWGAYFSDEGLTSLMRGLLLWWDIHPFAKNKKHPYNNILRSTNLWIQQKQKKIRCADKTFEYPCARKLFQKCCQIDKIRLYRLMQKISSLRKKKLKADLKNELLKMFLEFAVNPFLCFILWKIKFIVVAKGFFWIVSTSNPFSKKSDQMHFHDNLKCEYEIEIFDRALWWQ